jgi:hypothetical protein
MRTRAMIFARTISYVPGKGPSDPGLPVQGVDGVGTGERRRGGQGARSSANVKDQIAGRELFLECL